MLLYILACEYGCMLYLSLLYVLCPTIDVYSNRPMVSFTPDWRNMFYNETLTISCLHPSNVQGNQTYTWYRNEIKMNMNKQNFTIDSIQLYDRAKYQCQAGSSEISEYNRPHVITDLTILRVSRLIFEGDILTLNCDSRLDMNTTSAQASFIKNKWLAKPMDNETYLFIGKVDISVTGTYECTKRAIFKNEVKDTGAEELIQVTELFSSPEIKISSYLISAGMNIMLTCVTTLHLLRANTELQFAFYRNGWHIQGFSPSNKYTVQSIQLDDSGDYSCEVRTIMNSVRKMSKLLSVLVQESVKPALTAHPNWDKLLRYDQVTLTCNDQRSNKFFWYKDNVKLYSTGKTLNVYASSDNDIGNYECQNESGEKSKPVHLDIFFVWLILQVPLYIHEGDSVTLRCKMWRTGRALNTTFYKDDNMIKFLGSETDLTLGTVSKNATGRYKCTRFIDTSSISKVYIAEEYISVAELFTSPEIRVNLHPVVEGADMTLTCHTTISLLRQLTRLVYAFYKNGKIVQEFSESKKYKISSAQLDDSGSYTCEAKSFPNIVKKMSKAVSINVQGMAVVTFRPNFGKILTTESMTLTCNVDPKIKNKQEYYWYKDSNQMNITQQSFTIQDALISDSSYYQCHSTDTHISEPLRLDVSNSNLIVQAPPLILEGDSLTLNCHSRWGLDLPRTEFHKDGQLLKVLENSSALLMGKVYNNLTGIYKCTKQNIKISFRRKYVADFLLPITEIITYLVLKVKTTPVVEGDPITLSCDVALNSVLNPLRVNTKLEFAFYKDGHKIRDFAELHTYQLKVAMVKDSGNYTCDVKCSVNDIVRTSQELEIDVQELFSTPVLTTSPSIIQFRKPMYLNCDFSLNPHRLNANVQPTIFKNGKFFAKSKYFRTFSVQQYNTGEYMCEVADLMKKIIKYSKATYILIEEEVVGVKISSDQPDPVMVVGSSVLFTCSVYKGTALSVIWWHNFEEIDKSCATFQVRQDGRVLFIESIQKEHSGFYHCNVSNHFSFSESNKLEVTVIEAIGGTFLTTDQKVFDLVPEDSFTFTCSLTQGNGYHVFWIHNKQHLENDASTYEFREGGKVLHIKSAQQHHEGSYQCKVKKNISERSTMVSESGTLILKISSKSGSYLKPMLIVLAVVSVLLISIVVYKYHRKLVKPHFLHKNVQKTTVLLEKNEDKVLLVDNMENSER
ncbi:hypothetical protein PRIEUP_LOCUS674, partial [Pristimantis euphronides]